VERTDIKRENEKQIALWLNTIRISRIQRELLAKLGTISWYNLKQVFVFFFYIPMYDH